MKTNILIFSLLVFGFLSCKKDRLEPQKEVRYEIKIANGNSCFYQYEGEARTGFTAKSGSIYSKSTTLNKGDKYYIKVEYSNTYIINSEYDYQVNIYSDGKQIDGIKTAFHFKRPTQGDSLSSENLVKYKIVELTGTVE